MGEIRGKLKTKGESGEGRRVEVRGQEARQGTQRNRRTRATNWVGPGEEMQRAEEWKRVADVGPG